MQNELEKLFLKTKPLSKMVKEATVVVDTNVLLSAYQTKDKTFEVILKVLEKLSSERRLKLPSHVIWEFSKNRPERIKDIAGYLWDFIKSVDYIYNPRIPKNLEEILPAINVLDVKEVGAVIQSQENVKKKLNEVKEIGVTFKKELQALALKLNDYLDDDPILSKYREIIEKSFYEDGKLSESELEKLGNERFKKNIPPGFRDKEKGINKFGDLAIWLQICALNDDVIFITFDNKDDWVYKDNKKNVLGARRELVQEFYEKTKGKTLKILHPSNFIDLYTEGEVSTDVTDELKAYNYSGGLLTVPTGSGKTNRFINAMLTLRQQEENDLVADCSKYEQEILRMLELIHLDFEGAQIYLELKTKYDILKKSKPQDLTELKGYLEDLIKFYDGLKFIYQIYFNLDEEI
ncbi:PIN-like domain-containing protein [Bacillus cereus]|nr:PIN-like domain-containing protein [Bacillus cereus]